MALGRPKGRKKVKMMLSIDEELRKDMEKIQSVLPVNWSEIVNQALFPAVRLMREAIEELKKGELADFDKVKYLLQGNVLEFISMGHKGMKGVEKDIEELKIKQKKAVKG